MSKYTYPLLLIVWIFWGCPSTIDIPLPAHESKLVINGVLNNEQQVQIFLSKSQGVTDTIRVNDIYVKGADVRLYEGERLLGRLYQKDTLVWFYQVTGDSISIPYASYLLDYVPEVGKTYRLEASHPDFDSVWTATTLPETSLVKSRRVELDQVTDQFESYFSSFLFATDADKPGYLELGGSVRFADSSLSPAERSQPLTFITSLNRPKVATPYSILWINQVQEIGQVFFKAESIDTRFPRYERIFWEFRYCDSIYYSYRTGFVAHNLSAFSEVALIFPRETEPIVSNVHGGYGILGSYSVIRDSM